LLELLVVLAILVLLAAAWPFAASRLFPAQQLRSEAQELLATLRSTQTLARVAGSPQTLAIAANGREYHVATHSHALAAGITLRGNGAEISTASVVFYPDGSSNGALLALVLPPHSLTVRVGALTGRAEVNP
jgi:Tfp pilus assembly protein FimT